MSEIRSNPYWEEFRTKCLAECYQAGPNFLCSDKGCWVWKLYSKKLKDLNKENSI